jgi:hypothetical protein
MTMKPYAEEPPANKCVRDGEHSVGGGKTCRDGYYSTNARPMLLRPKTPRQPTPCRRWRPAGPRAVWGGGLAGKWASSGGGDHGGISIESCSVRGFNDDDIRGFRVIRYAADVHA